MRIIKVYNKAFSVLTSFVQGEFVALEYSSKMGEIGDASFILDITRANVTAANLLYFNRVEIIEDGVVQWVGVIIRKRVRLNTVEVRCKELMAVLKKRLCSAAYVMNGQANTVLTALLNTINGVDSTGVGLGTLDIATAVNMTFDNTDFFTILGRIADAVGGQFIIDTARNLHFRVQVGSDLTAIPSPVIFKYNVAQIIQANILNFDVDEDGEDIATKAYGKTTGFTSTQNDAGLQASYGILEIFKNVRVANTQTDVDHLTAALLADGRSAPTLELSPDIVDNFKVGDLVTVKILDKLVNIDNDFQILEKSVKIQGTQKLIKVSINALSQDIVNSINDLNQRLNLVETKL